MSKWFHIKARAIDICKPDGKVITFWLWGKDKKQITDLVLSKKYKDIEWIREEKPSFI
tara:strand:- start:3563 stop:3736 length:174 start_codon:yes stop_codon:yes gene_type:complete